MNRSKQKILNPAALLAYLQIHVPALQSHKTTELALAGAQMTKEQVAKAEKELLKSPKLLGKRVLLLGNYFFEPDDSEETRRSRLRHIEWIVKNHPDHPILSTPFASATAGDDEERYTKIKESWLRHIYVKPDNLAILKNAAIFFHWEAHELAEGFLLQALEFKPNSREFRTHLAQLYLDWEGHEDHAYSYLQGLCSGPENELHFYQLSKLPAAAFEAGHSERAVAAANSLLNLAEKNQDNWNYGNAINEAHTTLGRVALERGDLDDAKAHLEQSSIDIDSPQIISFGPNLDLAEDLLTAGETTCVLNYLDVADSLCKTPNEHASRLRKILDDK